MFSLVAAPAELWAIRKLAINGLLGSAKAGSTGASAKLKLLSDRCVDGALDDPADFRTCPNRQKIDTLLSDDHKNDGKGMGDNTLKSKEESSGGECGIRTHGTVTRTTVFETALWASGCAHAAPKESHDQGANNAGCEPPQPSRTTVGS